MDIDIIKSYRIKRLGHVKRKDEHFRYDIQRKLSGGRRSKGIRGRYD